MTSLANFRLILITGIRRTLLSSDAKVCSPLRRSISKSKKPIYPPVNEYDIVEKFAKGSGPGGQKVNKSVNCVNLLHIPTGITVRCHETRSLDDNRKIARLRMQEKLDDHLYGEQSVKALQKNEHSSKKLLSKNRTKKRLEMKKQFSALIEKES